jgi:acetyltransferase-like isoleucine patch superfamily enzyme
MKRLTLRNCMCLYRYLVLRLRYPKLRVRPFSLDRGASIQISEQAQFSFGSNIVILCDFNAHFVGEVTIGNGVFFNRGCHVIVYKALSIGDRCLFGEFVSIHDENHVIAHDSRPIASRGFTTAPIVIGNNVWVEAKATILQGVTVGDNAVIGANAVVTHDVPSNTVVAGIPARVVRQI